MIHKPNRNLRLRILEYSNLSNCTITMDLIKVMSRIAESEVDESVILSKFEKLIQKEEKHVFQDNQMNLPIKDLQAEEKAFDLCLYTQGTKFEMRNIDNCSNVRNIDDPDDGVNGRTFFTLVAPDVVTEEKYANTVTFHFIGKWSKTKLTLTNGTERPSYFLAEETRYKCPHTNIMTNQVVIHPKYSGGLKTDMIYKTSRTTPGTFLVEEISKSRFINMERGIYYYNLPGDGTHEAHDYVVKLALRESSDISDLAWRRYLASETLAERKAKVFEDEWLFANGFVPIIPNVGPMTKPYSHEIQSSLDFLFFAHQKVGANWMTWKTPLKWSYFLQYEEALKKEPFFTKYEHLGKDLLDTVSNAATDGGDSQTFK